MKIYVLLLVISSFVLVSCESDSEPASVSRAWIRNAPPSAGVLAGYMIVHNPSTNPLTVHAAHSPRFGRVEFHHMRMQDGQMIMRPLPVLEVAAKTLRVLQPGSDHLMLFEPTAPVKAGERIPFTLQVSEPGGQPYALPLEFLVRNRAP